MAEEIFAYGSNRITIDREHCYLEINARKHSKKYTLDRDLRAIEKLKEHIERWGYFWIDGNGEGASKHGSLRLTIYKAYHPYGRDIDHTMPKTERYVYLCDGNPYNLTSANLYVYGDEVPYNQSRRIWHDEFRIWIKLTNQDRVFFTDYDPALYSLLCNTRLASWYVWRENGALPPRLTGWKSKRGTQRKLLKGVSKSDVFTISDRLFCKIDGYPVGLHTVVWLYHTGKIRVDDLEKSIKNGCKEMSETRLQIDHLRNNIQNNTIHNLTAMERAKNNSKNNLIVQINFPYFFIPVRVDDSFRVMCGKVDGEDVIVRRIICRDVDSFLDCLRKFRDVAKSSGEMLPIPEDRTRTVCISQMLIDDGREYHGKQYNVIEALLRASDDEFTAWDGDITMVFPSISTFPPSVDEDLGKSNPWKQGE